MTISVKNRDSEGFDLYSGDILLESIAFAGYTNATLQAHINNLIHDGTYPRNECKITGDFDIGLANLVDENDTFPEF